MRFMFLRYAGSYKESLEPAVPGGSSGPRFDAAGKSFICHGRGVGVPDPCAAQFASALSPALAGYMLTPSSFGWLLVVGGALKIVYDLLLLRMFQSVKPPEESTQREPT